MTEYRLYFFMKPRAGDARGHIQRVENVEGKDDAQAIAAAQMRGDGSYMELWDKGRMVKAFDA